MAIASRHAVRKLPSHKGRFSYARIPGGDGSVIYRLFRRDLRNVLHCEMRVFAESCEVSIVAGEINDARHRLRDSVDEIDLRHLGVIA